MKLLLLFIVVSLSVNGQSLPMGSYQKKMDSIYKANFKNNLKLEVIRKDYLIKIKPYEWLSVTVLTRLNKSFVGKLDKQNEIEPTDFIALGSYDIRGKIYISKKLRFVQRIFITGLNNENYFYSSGFIIKI